VLYDRDHYKLALGQLRTARSLIDRVAQDYVRLLKYGDSLYRCKELKRAALGRMCTLMKRQDDSLKYLEQVRQHMSRLPSIDPTARSLLLCGHPNVGKSSLMNRLTRADVEVQPYAFTTKALYVGHMDHGYLRWQVIDTPGVLDRPLEERNTIEMQAITALAHLRACALYLVDVSERCGFTLQQQADLFHSVKPLFANKPVMVVANKTDARSLCDLREDELEVLAGMEREARRLSGLATAAAAAGAGGGEEEEGPLRGAPGLAAALARARAGAEGGMVEEEEEGGEGGSGRLGSSSTKTAVDVAFLPMSALCEEGVAAVKRVACGRLLSHRVELKVATAAGARVREVASRLHVAMPKPRPGSHRALAAGAGSAPVDRPPVIPPGLAEARARRSAEGKPRTERDAQEEQGGAGVYSADDRRRWLLANPEWRHDVAPEIYLGHNVADFIDPEIDAKLAELEREEAAQEAEHALLMAQAAADAGQPLTEGERADLEAIARRKRQLVEEHRLKKTNKGALPHKVKAMAAARAGSSVAVGGMLRKAGTAPVQRLSTRGMREALGGMGVDTSRAEARARSESRGRKRARSLSRGGAGEESGEGGDGEAATKKRVHSSKSRSMSRGRSASAAPAAGRIGAGVSERQAAKAFKLADRSQARMIQHGKAGESDRHISVKKVKWQLAGKMPGHGSRNKR
jgi:nucleolar GTP-binding protein